MDGSLEYIEIVWILKVWTLWVDYYAYVVIFGLYTLQMGRGGERRANVLKSISSSSSSAVSTNYNNNPAEIFKKILYHVVKDAINSLFRATQSVCIRSVFSCGFSELLCVSSTTTSSSSSSFPQYNTVFFFSAVTFPFRELSSFYSPFRLSPFWQI